MPDLIYIKDFDITPENKEYLDFMDKMNKDLYKLLYIPMHLITPVVASRVVYPITNHCWSEYTGEENPTGLKFPTSPTTFKKISDYIEDDIEVFSGQMRQVRHSLGHVLDPWGRSIHDYSTKYKIVSGVNKSEIKVGPNNIEYLLTWVIETSLNKKLKVLVIWEEVSMAYVNKKKEAKFLDSFDPRRVDTTNIYKLES